LGGNLSGREEPGHTWDGESADPELNHTLSVQILWGLPSRVPLGEGILDVLLAQKVLDIMEKHVGGGIHLWDRSLLLSFPSLLLGVGRTCRSTCWRSPGGHEESFDGSFLQRRSDEGFRRCLRVDLCPYHCLYRKLGFRLRFEALGRGRWRERRGRGHGESDGRAGAKLGVHSA
jgi:hypothetical protein